MASQVDEGGAAFPTPAAKDASGSTVRSAALGMTLRDYFAAKAMQGLVERVGHPTETRKGVSFEMVAADAYAVADAMLKARSLRPSGTEPT